MPRIAGHSFTRVKNLDLHGNGTLPGVLALHQGSVDPSFGASDGDFLYNLNGNLVYEAAGVTTTLGAVGGVGTTWESLYANDTAWALNGAFTVTQSTANTITFNKTNVGAGAVITITNSGSGNDITGSASTWSFTALGALTAASVASAGAITCTAISDVTAGATLQVDGNAGGGVDIGSTSTGAITLGRATTITTGGLIVTAGGITVSDEFIDLIDNSNTVVGLRATNNTITSFGIGGTSTGMILFRSTSLTTGTLQRNQLTETALVGGFYFDCWDVTAGAAVFSIGEDGAVIIAGVAGNVLTLTLGNFVMTNGTVSITTTGTADVVAINSGAGLLTNNALIVSGAGVHTGVTTGSYVYIAPSGLTTGTALSVTAVGATSSVAVVDIQTLGLTTGTSLRIVEATVAFTTGARGILVDLVAATAGNAVELVTTGAYTGTGMLLASAGAMTTGILVSLVSTTGLTSGSLLRMTTSTAGAVATNGICSIRATGAYTSTTNAGLLDVQASSLVGTGTIVNIMATNGSQLTNTALNVEQTTTGAGYTGDFVRIVGTSTTGDCNLIAVTTASTSAGDGLSITGNGLVAGTSTLVNLIHGTSVLGAGNSMLRITSTGADTGTTTGCLLDLASSAATAGTLALVTSATLATGSGLVMALAGLTTGVGFSMTHATAIIASGGSMFRLNSGGIDTATTTGCLIDLASTASTAGTQVLMTFSGLVTGVGQRMVANSLTSGIMLDLESSAAGMAGSYIRCFDGAAVDFSVGVDGRVVLAGSAGIAAIAVTAGDITTADGAMASAREQVTLAAAAAAIAVDSNVVEVTGDGGGNSVTTITGGVAGQILVLIFVDGNVTIVDDNAHGANTIDIVGANTTFADDATLTLIFDGTSWYELTRSIND